MRPGGDVALGVSSRCRRNEARGRAARGGRCRSWDRTTLAALVYSASPLSTSPPAFPHQVQRGGAWKESGCPWTDANITFTQLGGLQSVSASGWHYAKKPSAEREDVGGSVTSATRGPSVTASDGERGPIRFYSHPVRKTSAGGLRKWVKRRDVAGVPVAGLNMDHLSPLCVRLKGQSRQAPAGESASCGSVLKVHLLPGLTPPGLQRAAEHNQEICTKGISITGTILQVSSGIQGDLF